MSEMQIKDRKLIILLKYMLLTTIKYHFIIIKPNAIPIILLNKIASLININNSGLFKANIKI